MHVLLFSGYNHPSHHRKVELLADAPNVEIRQILLPDSGKKGGVQSSANGRREYYVREVPVYSLGEPGDVHRIYQWPPVFGIRAWKPDIIQCEHELESVLTAEIAIAARFAAPGARLIVYSWQNILRNRTLPVRMISHFNLRSAHHAICASTEAVSVLQSQGYAKGATVMPLMGLDRRYFYPNQTALRTQLKLGKFVVGYIGRLVPEKGIDLILRAVAQMQQSVDLLIVGDGPEKAQLQSLATQLGIGERCLFVAAVPQTDVVNYYNVMDVLALPSRTTANWKEQFGRVLVEAMACKVVVVGSNSGAIPEVVGDAGCIFPEGDFNALATILNHLETDKEYRYEIAERGYQRALATYSIERLATNTLDLWETLRR